MARKAGSIVVDQLRDRILLGLYLGRWGVDDRLPSVREVAEAEGVDRKTAAAAYRRLREEGLVRVEPRSGVYLCGDGDADRVDPLRRLHLQWLEHALSSAAELGLDGDGIRRLLQSLSVVEQRRIPVLDGDEAHAELLARELEARTGFSYAAMVPGQATDASPQLREAPLVVGTPRAVGSFTGVAARLPRVRATLDPALVEGLVRAAEAGPVRVVVATDALREELESALQQGLMRGGQVRLVAASTAADVGREEENPGRLLIWPGTPGRTRAAERRDGDLRGEWLLSAATVSGVRSRMARTAMDILSRSSGGATRQ